MRATICTNKHDHVLHGKQRKDVPILCSLVVDVNYEVRYLSRSLSILCLFIICFDYLFSLLFLV
ncbi:uncharacterized protein BDW47DRAFT_13790 [Aspergillus candidus]|uniref:Uncharacterized protein n=1 Tax=Aspergillus candidus TaxID=41067 RepID=A0A2I2FG09_ASPCN|nr:hypothetical protein BDW47DRAFT_13790 [Aspergillus candidus]PLB39547.1 hypothetical protein BDW47DRAFT_13790 [Aspergillus candidus]